MGFDFFFSMKILIEKDNIEKELDFRGTCADLLKLLNINPEEVLVIVNGELFALEDECDNDSVIKLLSVVSGG